MVDGKQLTIAWYVKHTNISHEDSKVVSWLIKEHEKVHGKMTVYRDNKQTFIGMDVELIKDKKKLKILTKDYIVEAIEDFGEDVGLKVVTPTKCDLLEIDELSRIE